MAGLKIRGKLPDVREATSLKGPGQVACLHCSIAAGPIVNPSLRSGRLSSRLVSTFVISNMSLNYIHKTFVRGVFFIVQVNY